MRDQYRQLPLECAVGRLSGDALLVLLAHGADPTLTSDDGTTSEIADYAALVLESNTPQGYARALELMQLAVDDKARFAQAYLRELPVRRLLLIFYV